jgi:Uncharacterized conserved protein
MRIVLYSHTGSGNHGCEAIVRGTVNLLGEDFTLLSRNREEDIRYDLDAICRIEEEGKRFAPYSARHILLKGLSFFQPNIYEEYAFCNLFRQEGDFFFSIGGDAYCYENAAGRLAYLNKKLHGQGKKTVLWGCSIEPKLLESAQFVEDMNNYDLIIARESMTYKALKSCGTCARLLLLPDPAFFLTPEEVTLPEVFRRGKVIGINASPLICKTNPEAEAAYGQLVRYIMEETDYNILLIPHVNWKHDNDYDILNRLYDIGSNPHRIEIVSEDYNCAQLKYLISKCFVMVTARTHASIAAYSTGVPAIVAGYSIKSIGIALDLLGSTTHHVVDMRNMTAPDSICKAFQWMVMNRESVSSKLKAACEKISAEKNAICSLVADELNNCRT